MKHAYLLAFSVFSAALPAAARADRRSFTETYEYATAGEAETELEVYTAHGRRDGAKTVGLELAIEHGVTERWDVAVFHRLAQAAGGPLGFEQLAVRTRYRFSERGELPVDLLALAEAARVFGPHAYQGEARLVVARELGPVTAALNLIGVVGVAEVDGSFETELDPAGAFGLTWSALPTLRLGGEIWGARVDDAIEASAGPAISWAPASSFWATVTAGVGVTDDADDYAVRLAIGAVL